MFYQQNREQQKPVGEIYYTRFEDGGQRVEVLPFGYQVLETGAIYTSRRSLLQSVVKSPSARNWTFERYFKLGKWAPPATPEPELPLTELFKPRRTVGLTVARPLPHQNLMPGLTVARLKPKKVLGIDLHNRAHEVKKLLFHGFGTQIFSGGYDPDEVLQEVYRGLLKRNDGTCAWDADKSSFGHYVHMVASCILSNYRRRENRRRSIEQVGMPTVEGDDSDVSEMASDQAPLASGSVGDDIPDWVEEDLAAHLRSQGQGPEVRLAIKMIPLLRQGLNQAEIASALAVPKTNVSRALKYLRTHAQSWGSLH